MSKNLYIAEKPSVAKQFAEALGENMRNQDGFMEGENSVITWCVGHLVTMSYPEIYDEKFRRWRFDTIPFIPESYLYEVIPSASKQFETVKRLLNREDVSVIYIATDSGREGEYIYRLVDQMAGVGDKQRKRVWIDSQTNEEILRGIREAKDWSEYDALSDAAYLRAKEDYLMGINFSRALTLKYSNALKSFLNRDKCVIAAGRVMTCVLGIIVAREREIRNFVKTPFYRVVGNFALGDSAITAEWKAVPGSAYEQSPLLYKENGFKTRESAERLIADLQSVPEAPVLDAIERKKERKNPPLLYNLAELQNDCSKFFKISPNQTLEVAQELYEKKMTTYPRTDARVLSSAVAKEIDRNIRGLQGYGVCSDIAADVITRELYKGIEKTRYVNDKDITDHYAIIPTGQGLGNLASLSPTSAKVYEMVVRRFLSVFYPAAIYQKITLTILIGRERFFANFKVLEDSGYLPVTEYSFKKKEQTADADASAVAGNAEAMDNNAEKTTDNSEEEDQQADDRLMESLKKLSKGELLVLNGFELKEGETSPPKRYNGGSMILTMENAGQFIESDELREQIKGSGIGTSATRAGILEKLEKIEYIKTNKKTQILTPTLLGELIYDVVNSSLSALLNPTLTASWEKGLSMVAAGEITSDEYLQKMNDFVIRRTNIVKQMRNQNDMTPVFEDAAKYYKK